MQGNKWEELGLTLFREERTMMLLLFFSVFLVCSLHFLMAISNPNHWYLPTLATAFSLAMAAFFLIFCRWATNKIETRIMQKFYAAKQAEEARAKEAEKKAKEGRADELDEGQIDELFLNRPRWKSEEME